MPVFIRCAFIVCALLFVLSPLARAEEPAEKSIPYLTPELFASSNKLADYLPYAKAFVREHAGNSQLPRVHQDIMMMATLMNSPQDVKEAKVFLLMDHLASLQTQYLAKTSKPDELRDLLKARFTSPTAKLDRATLDKFFRAGEHCTRLHGLPLGDDEFWLQMALAATDAETAGKFRQLIKSEGKARQTLEIVLDSSLTLRDKFISLQTLRNYDSARAYQRYLFDELTDEERGDRNVRVIVVENLLHDHKFSEAVPPLTELVKEHGDPQHLFWLGWALASTGKIPEAAQQFKTLQDAHSNDPWAKVGAEFAAALPALEKSLQGHAAAFEKVAQGILAAPPEVVELTLLYRNEEDRIWSAYGRIDVPGDAFEVVCASGDETKFAYRVGADGCQLFLDSDTAIHRYQKHGLCPIFTLSVSPKPGGGFAGNFNFNTAKQGAGAIKQTLTNLCAMPLFANPVGRRALIVHLVRSGTFPLPVESDGEITTYRWITPKLDSPELHMFSIAVSKDDNVLSALDERGVGVANVRYGKAQDIKLAPPAWPNRPINTVEEFSAQEFFRLFGAIASQLEAKPAATGMAE